jgi:elongation factor P
MATTSDLSRGCFIKFNGELCQVTEYQHRTPGNLRAFYQVNMKVIRTGKQIENRFRAGEEVELVRVETRPLQYLYKDGDHMVCMDNETFEQIYVPENLFGNSIKLLKEGINVEVAFESELPIFASPPSKVDLQITYVEPAVAGNTATNTLKPATMETGATVMVPLFIEDGEMIRVDTSTGAYVERVK